jgi:hypothetical protein
VGEEVGWSPLPFLPDCFIFTFFDPLSDIVLAELRGRVGAWVEARARPLCSLLDVLLEKRKSSSQQKVFEKPNVKCEEKGSRGVLATYASSW